MTGRCARCALAARKPATYNVLVEEAARAPSVNAVDTLSGTWAIATDTHIPWHNPDALHHLCQVSDMLGVRNLVIGGDVIHADTISKYIGVGKSVAVSEELLAAGRVMAALLEVFTERIVLMPGNHDQRVERMVAGLQDTAQGRRALDVVAGLLGVKATDDSEVLSQAYLARFFGDPRIAWTTLPQVVLNDAWLIQHPGTQSRIGPQNERAMAHKHRKSVIQGHSHLWALGFDTSGQDVAFNCGHLASPEKWRYMREKPTTYPMSVLGYGIIYQTQTCRAGKLLPVALHPKMFDPLELVALARGGNGNQA